jgi:hypothetical protein
MDIARETAQTILQQLGGNRFLAMTGARNITFGVLDGGNVAVNMQLPGARDHKGQAVNRLRITLDASDTYTVQTFYARGMALRPVDDRCNVYCDQLQDVFTRLTGLYTRF